MPGKGRATSYSDFYKGAPANQTPGSKQVGKPGYGVPKMADDPAEMKKEALKRRLKKTAFSMKAKSKRAR
jgi:hypothetical protein